jgi:hypothetical protein
VRLSRRNAVAAWVVWRSRRDSVVGWFVWQVVRRRTRKKIQRTGRRLAAAGVVALVLAAGFLAARWSEGS